MDSPSGCLLLKDNKINFDNNSTAMFSMFTVHWGKLKIDWRLEKRKFAVIEICCLSSSVVSRRI